ncbi:pyridoxine 5'-phosphate synthase [Gilvimarinus agarilyticus]|uniref:pyridoxine 5'-phosphate synthase n=1 Tax=Gilvimarinus sp. 2_MG-2023 TaxID=3062666 RepID=UPI001C0A4EC6|nr:pyridoxine 5'-phosphate synthase [Gilvimarinus sp. 2_MG-2023]MBU2885100.1 pyridoxine 5'-phosphate synthase [Gilvimarinus agarilyticus]MDO6569997.1 pyridoxine 5'-phosphate synthase [Gilvimarinus sp. 2_MG-2023]
MTTALSVNLNKVALIRNSRTGNFPDVTEFGRICLDSGAAGLTVHPRPDQRHIRPSDVRELAALCHASTQVEFNIEGNPFAAASGNYPGLLALVAETNPDQCTLVPDSNDQLTSDHGFDLYKSGETLKPIIQQLHAQGVRVSLFMDPDPEQIVLAHKYGVERIELYTGPYAEHYGTPAGDKMLQHYRLATEHAVKLGLQVNAGHDLNLDNLPDFLRIGNIAEVSIGHALTVDALRMGMASAVEAYRAICEQ